VGSRGGRLKVILGRLAVGATRRAVGGLGKMACFETFTELDFGVPRFGRGVG